MDALVTASFLLVGWNTYSAIVVAKDTYTGKMPGPKSIGYSIAGLAGLTAFMLYTYGIAAEKHPELLEAEGDGELSWDGGRMVSIEENTTVNYYWRTSPDDIDVDEWDIGSQVEEKVQEEMYDEGDSGSGYWHFNNDDGKDVEVEYNWDKVVEDGEEEYIKSWAETDESFSAEDREDTERMTRPEAEALADKVEKLVAPYTDRVEVCGSYRRGSSRPGDLDVIIIPKKGVTLPDMVKAINPSAVNWIGEKKTQVIIDGRKVDFRVSSPKGWGAAQLYFTGPAGYNIGMRMRAKKMGMKLNEYGIFDRATDKYLGGATEDEIYKVLGKTPKLPAERSKRAEGETVTELKCAQCGSIGETFTVRGRHFCGPICLHKYEGLAAESWLNEGECALCNNDAKFVVEDLPVGSRGFCCEACYAHYVGLPLKEEGYYGLASEGKNPTGIKIKKCPSCHEMQPMDEDMEACDDCAYCEYCDEYHPYEIRRICYEEAYSKHYEGPAEVFEAPRATYTDPAQQSFEKSYNIRAKKPLNKIVKESLDGQLPSDDSRRWRSGGNATDVTAADYKLIQGYATIQNMAYSRFETTNSGWADTNYNLLTATNVIAKSIEKTPYLAKAVKHYHGLFGCKTDQEKIDYMNNANMTSTDFEEMLDFIRYYDITETGPYKGTRMVATDRAPYETGGGYGNVYYNSRNPYGHITHATKFGEYDKTNKEFSLSSKSVGATFTRLTKLRPYKEIPERSQDADAYVGYSTEGGYGYRGSGSQSFRLTSFICPESARDDQRNPDPGYSSRQTRAGWRYDTKGWEEVKSAPYRYATLVYLPTVTELQLIHGTAKFIPGGQGSLSRPTIVSLYNEAKKLWTTAKAQADAKQKRLDEKVERENKLKSKNTALTELENATKAMQDVIKSLVKNARKKGVPEDEIYDALEHTFYDIEEMVQDWEPGDYFHAETEKQYGCKVCGTGPHPATILEDKVFVFCPTCGFGEGSEDATGWNVTWSQDTPDVMHNRPFADVEWDTPSEG